MFLANRLRGGHGGAKPIAAQFGGSAFNGNSQSSYTFSGMDFGVESDRSFVVVTVAGRENESNRSISSVTIGGVAASAIVSVGGYPIPAGIYLASPSGTSGSIVVNFSNSVVEATVAVYSIYFAKSSSALDTASATTTSLSGSVDVNAEKGGVVIAFSKNLSNSVRTATWSGITEQFDENTDNNSSHSGGLGITDNETPRTVSIVWSGSIARQAVVAASWR